MFFSATNQDRVAMDSKAAGLLHWLDEHQNGKSVIDSVMEQLQGAGMDAGALRTAAATPVCLQASSDTPWQPVHQKQSTTPMANVKLRRWM